MKDVVREAPVTLGILVLYVAVFFGFRLYDPPPVREVEDIVKHVEHFLKAGAMMPIHVEQGELWRLVSYSFAHGDWIHLLFNSYFLFQIGPLMERELGAVRYLALYLVSSVTGALAVFFFSERIQLVVGGSGGLFGLVGGIVAIQMRAGRYATEFLEWHSGRQVIGLIVVNLVLGFLLPMISQAGHVGGLVGGFLLTFLYLRPRKNPDVWSWVYQAGFAMLFASLVLYSGHPFLRL